MTIRMVRMLLTALFTFHCSLFTATAQVGEYRTDFAVGFNGGYSMSSIAYVPKVPLAFRLAILVRNTLRASVRLWER